MADEVWSPDRRVLVKLSCHESLPTQWICGPRVTVEPEGEILLDLWDADAWRWDARVSFDSDGLLRLTFREYPGTSAECVVVVDTAARTYRIESGRPARFLEKRLDIALRPAT